MLQYYSPNQSVYSALRSALGKKDAEEKVTRYFRAYTGKEFVLVTASCRSALHLTYKALNIRGGNVLTTPLTCEAALAPILWSGCSIEYADIQEATLNVDPARIDARMGASTSAIQVTHLGGYPVDMEPILSTARKSAVPVVEDCAQGFGARYRWRRIGTFGHVSCFSLIKNCYGIGGGVLCTNDRDIFEKARSLQADYVPLKRSLSWYRLIRNVLETKRGNRFARMIYRSLMRLRNEHVGERSRALFADQVKYAASPDLLTIRVASRQLEQAEQLGAQRIARANAIFRSLGHLNAVRWQRSSADFDGSYVKLFVWSNRFDRATVRHLNEHGLEAMHLAHRLGGVHQVPFYSRESPYYSRSIRECPVYARLHDQIVSLPLFEEMRDDQVEDIVKTLERVTLQTR